MMTPFKSIFGILLALGIPGETAQANSKVDYVLLTEPILRSDSKCPNRDNDSQDVCPMNYSEAEEFCDDLGLELPTIRQLALFAGQKGARGLHQRYNSGDSQIRAIDDFGYAYLRNRFFYNSYGFQPDGSSAHLWSRSVDYDHPENNYNLGMRDGHIYSAVRAPTLPVNFTTARCVRRD